MAVRSVTINVNRPPDRQVAVNVLRVAGGITPSSIGAASVESLAALSSSLNALVVSYQSHNHQHNSSQGIQGGSTGQFYHLTSAELGVVTGVKDRGFTEAGKILAVDAENSVVDLRAFTLSVGAISFTSADPLSYAFGEGAAAAFLANLGGSIAGVPVFKAGTQAALAGLLAGAYAGAANLFANNVADSIGANWTHSNGVYTSDANNSSGYNGVRWSNLGVVSGGVYLLAFNVTARTSGALQVLPQNQTTFQIAPLFPNVWGQAANLTHIGLYCPNAAYGSLGYLNIRCANGFVGSIGGLKMIRLF